MLESEKIFNDILSKPFDFNKDEVCECDFEELAYVKTKDQLIRLIFTLHNDVNTKLKKRPFDFVNLLSTYQDHNFKNVLVQYYNTFIAVNFGEKMMRYSFRRKLFLKNFHTYFKDNIDLYDL